MSELGYIEWQNVEIEYRWAEGHYERLPALAAELVRLQVDVLVAAGAVHTVLAAKAATATIPIAFANSSDPLKFGLVASLSRPGGNVTGVSFFTSQLEAKRLGLLHELVPGAATIAALVNPTNSNAEIQSRDLRQAATALGLRLHILNPSTEHDLESTFIIATRMRAGALAVAADPFFFSQHKRLVALAASHALPAIYEWREFADAGGLASYGTSFADGYRQLGIYTGRLLRKARCHSVGGKVAAWRIVLEDRPSGHDAPLTLRGRRRKYVRLVGVFVPPVGRNNTKATTRNVPVSQCRDHLGGRFFVRSPSHFFLTTWSLMKNAVLDLRRCRACGVNTGACGGGQRQ